MKKWLLSKKFWLFGIGSIAISSLAIVPIVTNNMNNVSSVQEEDEIKAPPDSKTTSAQGFLTGSVKNINQKGIWWTLTIDDAYWQASGATNLTMTFDVANQTDGIGGTISCSTCIKNTVVNPWSATYSTSGNYQIAGGEAFDTDPTPENPYDNYWAFGTPMRVGDTYRLGATVTPVGNGDPTFQVQLIDVLIPGLKDGTINLAWNATQDEIDIYAQFVKPEAYWVVDYINDGSGNLFEGAPWQVVIDVQTFDTTTGAVNKSNWTTNDTDTQMVNQIPPVIIDETDSYIDGTSTKIHTISKDITNTLELINSGHIYSVSFDTNADGQYSVADLGAYQLPVMGPDDIYSNVTFSQNQSDHQVSDTWANIQYTWSGINDTVIYWEVYQINNDDGDGNLQNDPIEWNGEVPVIEGTLSAPGSATNNATGTISIGDSTTQPLEAKESYIIIASHEGNKEITQSSYESEVITTHPFGEYRFTTSLYMQSVAPKNILNAPNDPNNPHNEEDYLKYGSNGISSRSALMEFQVDTTASKPTEIYWWLIDWDNGGYNPWDPSYIVCPQGPVPYPELPDLDEIHLDVCESEIKIDHNYSFYASVNPIPDSADPALIMETTWSLGNQITVLPGTVRYDFTTEATVDGTTVRVDSPTDINTGYSYTSLGFEVPTIEENAQWSLYYLNESGGYTYFATFVQEKGTMSDGEPRVYSQYLTQDLKVLDPSGVDTGVEPRLQEDTTYQFYYAYGGNNPSIIETDFLNSFDSPLLVNTNKGLSTVEIAQYQTIDGTQTGTPIAQEQRTIHYTWDTEVNENYEDAEIYYWIDLTPNSYPWLADGTLAPGETPYGWQLADNLGDPSSPNYQSEDGYFVINLPPGYTVDIYFSMYPNPGVNTLMDITKLYIPNQTVNFFQSFEIANIYNADGTYAPPGTADDTQLDGQMLYDVIFQYSTYPLSDVINGVVPPLFDEMNYWIQEDDGNADGGAIDDDDGADARNNVAYGSFVPTPSDTGSQYMTYDTRFAPESTAVGQLEPNTTYRIYMAPTWNTDLATVRPDNTLYTSSFTTDMGLTDVEFVPSGEGVPTNVVPGWSYVWGTYNYDSRQDATIYIQMFYEDNYGNTQYLYGSSGAVETLTFTGTGDLDNNDIINQLGMFDSLGFFENETFTIRYSMTDWKYDGTSDYDELITTTDTALWINPIVPKENIGMTSAEILFEWISLEAGNIYYRSYIDVNKNGILDVEEYNMNVDWVQADVDVLNDTSFMVDGLESSDYNLVQFSMDDVHADPDAPTYSPADARIVWVEFGDIKRNALPIHTINAITWVQQTIATPDGSFFNFGYISTVAGWIRIDIYEAQGYVSGGTNNTLIESGYFYALANPTSDETRQSFSLKDDCQWGADFSAPVSYIPLESGTEYVMVIDEDITMEEYFFTSTF